MTGSPRASKSLPCDDVIPKKHPLVRWSCRVLRPRGYATSSISPMRLAFYRVRRRGTCPSRRNVIINVPEIVLVVMQRIIGSCLGRRGLRLHPLTKTRPCLNSFEFSRPHPRRDCRVVCGQAVRHLPARELTETPFWFVFAELRSRSRNAGGHLFRAPGREVIGHKEWHRALSSTRSLGAREPHVIACS